MFPHEHGRKIRPCTYSLSLAFSRSFFSRAPLHSDFTGAGRQRSRFASRTEIAATFIYDCTLREYALQNRFSVVRWFDHGRAAEIPTVPADHLSTISRHSAEAPQAWSPLNQN